MLKITRLDKLEILFNDAFHGPSSLRHIPLHPSREANVGICVDENLKRKAKVSNSRLVIEC